MKSNKQYPRRLETRETIAMLEKLARKTKKGFWKDIAERLKASRRKRAKVNLWKLGKLAEKFSGKTLVVPGKVLGTGEIKAKTSVVALYYSRTARQKISEKGNALTFREAIEKKTNPNNMVIVK